MHSESEISTRPAWITAEIMANTRRVWEPRYGHPLSDAEIVEMIVGVTRLYDVLTTPNTAATEIASKTSSQSRSKAIEPAAIG